MKKLTIAFILCLLIFSLSVTTVFGATIKAEDTKLEVTDQPVCTIQINENAVFEKKLTNVDLENKKLTIQMSIQNNAEKLFANKTEIFFVIDNSTSMNDAIAENTTRLQAVTSSAKFLASELLKQETIHVGVVSFSTGDNEGTITDASLKLAPSRSSEDIIASIDAIGTDPLGERTNIDAGLSVAKQNFSEDCQNRYIILLSDGVPNTAVGGPILTYSGEVATKTKNTLTSLANSGTQIFTVLTGVPNATESSSNKTYQELAEEIFGTPENPTVGSYYYIQDSEIEETITEDILSAIVDLTKNDLYNINIYDYFPQEIVDNFDFSYVTDATMGSISREIITTSHDNVNTNEQTNTQNTQTNTEQENYILWHLDTLLPQESATVTYQLSIKPDIQQEIIGIVLNTNKKIRITTLDNSIIDTVPPSTDDQGQEYNVDTTSEVSPKIQLTSIRDTTVANTVIPQTGNGNLDVTTFVFIGIIVIVIGLATVKIYSSRN